MAITLVQAMTLKRGDVLEDDKILNKDRTPQRWRVNGKPKIWKKEPKRVQIPVKRGLFEYSTITEQDLCFFNLV